jgi:hypothetical protein
MPIRNSLWKGLALLIFWSLCMGECQQRVSNMFPKRNSHIVRTFLSTGNKSPLLSCRPHLGHTTPPEKTVINLWALTDTTLLEVISALSRACRSPRFLAKSRIESILYTDYAQHAISIDHHCHSFVGAFFRPSPLKSSTRPAQ